MTRIEKGLRFAARVLGGATLLTLLAECDSLRMHWYRDEVLGEAAVALLLTVLLLLILSLGMKRARCTRYLPALGRTAAVAASGAAMGLAMGLLLQLLVKVMTAAVSLRG